MKTIILAAIAATFATNVHASEPTFAESCGHLDNPTRFNPTELSEYQECWLGFHKPDEMAGVLGNIFWARAGDMTVSMPVSTLTNAGSKSAAAAIVVDRIVEVVNNERIEELEGMVDELEAAKAVLVADLAAAVTAAELDAATIASLRSELGLVEAARDMLQAVVDGEAGRISAAVAQATIDARVGYVTDAVAAQRYNDGYAASTLSAQNDFRDDINGILGTSHDTLLAAQIALRAHVSGEAARTVAAIAAARTAALMGTGLSEGTAGFDADRATRSIDGDDADNLSDIGRGWTGVNLNQTFSSGGLFITVAGDVVRYGTTGDNLWDVLNDAVEDVYDRGFNDGYDEGYTEGYADGFADGVASVN